MTDYFNLNDSLTCLEASKIFWCGKPAEECRLELLKSSMRRNQQTHWRVKQIKVLFDDANAANRCNNCGVKRVKKHKQRCDKMYKPKEEHPCKWCGSIYPTWKGSPHSRWKPGTCAVQPATCEGNNQKTNLFFPNLPCKFNGCLQALLYHKAECSIQVCSVCQYEVHVMDTKQHSGSGERSGWCRALRDY